MQEGRRERITRHFTRCADESTNLPLDIRRITQALNTQEVLLITKSQHKNHLAVNHNQLKNRILCSGIKISSSSERNGQFIGFVTEFIQRNQEETGIKYSKVLLDSQLIDFHDGSDYETRTIAKTLVYLGRDLVKKYLTKPNTNCFEVIMNPANNFVLGDLLSDQKTLDKVEDQNYRLNKKMSLVLNKMKEMNKDFVQNHFLLTNSDVMATVHALVLYQGSEDMHIGYKYIWAARDTNAPSYLVHKAQLYVFALASKGLLIQFINKFKHGKQMENDKILDEPPQLHTCIQALQYHGRSGQLRNMDDQHHRYMINGEAFPLPAEIMDAPYKHSNDVVMFNQDPIPGPSGHQYNPIVLDDTKPHGKPHHVCNSNLIPVRSTTNRRSNERKAVEHNTKKLTSDQLTAALRQTVNTMNTTSRTLVEVPIVQLSTAEKQLDEIKKYNNNFQTFTDKVMEINSAIKVEQEKLVEKFETLRISNIQENENENKALKDKLKLLTIEKDELQISNTEMSSKTKIIEENNKFLIKENEVLEERNDAYKKRLKLQATQSEDEEAQQQDKWRLENEVCILKERAQALSKENLQMKQKMTQLEQENGALSSEKKKLQQEQIKLIAVHNDNERLIKNTNILEEKFKTKDDQCNELTVELEQLTDEVNKKYEKISALEEKIENLKSSKEESATIAELQKTIDNQSDQIMDYQSNLGLANEMKQKYDAMIMHLPKSYNLQNIDLDDTSSVRAKLAEQQEITNSHLTFVTSLMDILVIQTDEVTGLMLVKLIIQTCIENNSFDPYISKPKVENIKQGLAEINNILFPPNPQITQTDGNAEPGPSTVKKRKK